MALRSCCEHHSPLEMTSSYRTKAPQRGSMHSRTVAAASSSIHPTSSRQQTQSRSASEQLQSYIDRFEREQTSPKISTATDALVLGPQAAKNSETDAWDLLCGSGARGQNFAGSPVSVKTRCILQDVDRTMGYTEPCYSSPAKLDLQSLWPSMHEHLERRWRQQLRDRYEERQRSEKAAKASAAAASAGSSFRADMYKYSRISAGASGRQVRQSAPPSQSKLEASSLSRAVRALLDSDNEDDAEGSDSESGAGSSMLEAAAAAAAATAQSTEERFWGSDSGLGLSCNGASASISRDKKTMVAEAATVDSSRKNDEADANDTVGDADGDSFEERMRSYRCVLEAHELSSRLRQHLEAACATVGTGRRRVLSVEDKGRIRDRLAQLQGPLRGGLAPPDDRVKDPKTPQQLDQEAERITTERLSRLMCSARSLLETKDGDAGETRRLSGNLWEQQDQHQEQQLAVSEAEQHSGQG